MKQVFEKAAQALRDPSIRKRILFTAAMLVLFRAVAAIPIPGVNELRLESLLANNQFFGLLNVFSGGGLSQLSIVMLGVGPYITASIIMQLMTMMFPKLKAIYQEEGEAGRAKFAQWTRLLSVPLALIQSFGFLKLLANQGIIEALSGYDMAINMVVITAGSILLMWLGEIITEFGIGNGTSLIIFAGIVAALPTHVSQTLLAFDPSQIVTYVLFALGALAVICAVVFITEAERPIPVTYAKRVRGNKVYGGVSTYIPLRLNQAGVIPIVFALSILLFPQMISQFLTASSNPVVADYAARAYALLTNGWFHGVAYFVFVFLFTYFYTAVTFDPNQIATNLQKNGAFIPGVRPGETTSAYIAKILTRLTFVGALFLSLIAILPLVVKALTGVTALAIGGTALLIVISVVLDLVKKIDAQVAMREY